MNYTKLN